MFFLENLKEENSLHVAKNMIYLLKIGLINERLCIKLLKPLLVIVSLVEETGSI